MFDGELARSRALAVGIAIRVFDFDTVTAKRIRDGDMRSDSRDNTADKETWRVERRVQPKNAKPKAKSSIHQFLVADSCDVDSVGGSHSRERTQLQTERQTAPSDIKP